MKKLYHLLIFLLMFGFAWGQTIEETIADINQLKSDLEAARLTVESKIAELGLSPLNIAPKDAFESEADYLNRLQNTQIELNDDIISLRRQHLESILEQLYALQSKTYTTTDLAITQGTYNPENETWPVTVNHRGYQRESVQINIPIKKDLARILNSSWDRTTLTGQLAVDYDNKVVLTSITITNPDSGLNYSHSQNRRWKEIKSNDGALQLEVSDTNRYIIRAIDGLWNCWVGLNDLNDPNLKLTLGFNIKQDDSGDGTLAVSPNELNAAYIDEGGKVCQLIIGTDSKKFSDRYDQSIYTLEYTPDGRYIFAGLSNGKVYVYESTTMKLVKIYNTTIGSFKKIKCTAGDVFYLLGYEYNQVWVKAIDYKLGNVVKNISLDNIWNQFQLNYGGFDSIVEARFAGDGKILVITTGKNVCAIDLASVTLLAAYKNSDEKWANLSAALSNDGNYWGLLKYKSDIWQSQYAMYIASAGDARLVASFITDSGYLDDPIINWTKDNKYLILEGSGLYRTGLGYNPSINKVPDLTETASSELPAGALESVEVKNNKKEPDSVPREVVVFTDDFNDNSIGQEKWIVTGNKVIEQNGILQIMQAETDKGGIIKSKEIYLGNAQSFTLTRKAKVHHVNDYSMPSLVFHLDDLPQFGVNYCQMTYNSGTMHPCSGIIVSYNGSNPHVYKTAKPEASKSIPGLWDQWFDEKVTYDVKSGNLDYYLNGNLQISIPVGVSKAAEHQLSIDLNSWGWWTGNYHHVDDFCLSVVKENDSTLQKAILDYEKGDYQTSLEALEIAANSSQDIDPAHYWYLALNLLSLGANYRDTAILWVTKYLESGDDTYRDEADRCLSILENQNKIFAQSSIEILPERLASPFGERNFVVSPDGQWLYFSAMTSDNQQQADIYRAPRINSQWGIPAKVAELSTPEEETLCSFSMDGNKAWLAGKYTPGKADFDIYASDQGVSQWQAPSPVAALNSSSQDLDPWVHEDRLIFFSSNRAGGYGGYDLYISRFRNGAWSSPINLGAAVNTAYDETAPFMDWPGKNLFYSSNAPVGLGGADIYRVAVLNGETMEVSQPQNLGVPLNSRHNDLRYIKLKNSTESLVISDRGKQRKPNMYLAYSEYPEQEGYYTQKTDGSLQWNWIAQTTQGSQTLEIELKGKVSGLSTINASTKIEISYVKDGEQHRNWTVADPNGQYKATLPVSNQYTIELSVPGYYRHFYVLNASAGETVLRHDIIMSKLETQVSVILNNIFFAYDSDEILPSSIPSLDNAVNTLLDNPLIKVEISGHTSTEGADDYNLELSRKRAKSVVEYLIRRGISTERLSWKGYGETKPLNDNSTDEMKQKNRRVEFKVL